MSEPLTPPIEGDEAEHLALEAAVAEARADPRPDIPHAIVREQLLRDAERARQYIAEQAARLGERRTAAFYDLPPHNFPV
jgi:hypothetical protein